jgi:hypothetical protein
MAYRMKHITVRLDNEVCVLAECVAAAKGITLAEHVRTLVIDDLDRRKMLDSRIGRPLPLKDTLKTL